MNGFLGTYSVSLDDKGRLNVPVKFRTLLEHHSPHAVLAFQLSTPDGTTNDALDEYLTKLTLVRPDLDGLDVIALGVPRGPRVGEALQMLKNARLDRTVESRNDETLLVRQFVTKLDQE